jgi:hypothetical protein
VIVNNGIPLAQAGNGLERTKKAATAAYLSWFHFRKMVAGVGFEPTTFRL